MNIFTALGLGREARMEPAPTPYTHTHTHLARCRLSWFASERKTSDKSQAGAELRVQPLVLVPVTVEKWVTSPIESDHPLALSAPIISGTKERRAALWASDGRAKESEQC